MSFPYFDYNATTPLDPRCRTAMEPYWDEQFANPASNHFLGKRAKRTVERARQAIRTAVGGTEEDLLILTGGATEANNLAILGCAAANAYRGRHIICSAIEHPSVLEPIKQLKEHGFDVDILPVNTNGEVDPHQLEAAIGPDTILVSVMAANNETGVVQDVPSCARICRRRHVTFHTDATQIVGKGLFHSQIGDLVSFSSHKLYGPKGIGALLIRREERAPQIKPISYGGGHEYGFRPGTVAVPLVVGFAKACELAMLELENEHARLMKLRDHFESRLGDLLKGHIQFNGQSAHRLPHVSNFSLHNVPETHRVIQGIQERIAVSPAAACHGAADRPSHVLTAMGLADDLALASIRWSAGRPTKIGDVEHSVRLIAEHVLQAVGGTPSVVAEPPQL